MVAPHGGAGKNPNAKQKTLVAHDALTRRIQSKIPIHYTHVRLITTPAIQHCAAVEVLRKRRHMRD